MNIKKKIIAAMLCVVSVFQLIGNVYADGTNLKRNVVEADITISVKDMLDDFSSKSVIVCETTTGKILFEKNSTEVQPISHLTKLMTLLLTAEKIDCGDITFKDKVTVSEHANSMQGSQIWLDKGEKITVDELVKSITVGNANDACCALAEYVGGSEKDFVDIMNERAKELGMTSTKYVDCTGISEENVSNAADLSILCTELLKYKNLKPYLTTWLDTVRDGKAELVNLNKLVRTYKGISGMKACASDKAGNCIVATAEKNGLSLCAVLLGASDGDKRDAEAKKILDLSFDTFEIYKPEIPKELLENIKVKGGERADVKLKINGLQAVVVPKGASWNAEIVSNREEQLTAPVKKGDKAGDFSVTLNDEIIIDCEICADENVNKINFKCGLGKLLYNLLNL